MNETKHSPEPWHAIETIGGAFYLTDKSDDHPLASMQQGYGEQAANARRIVACVNACAGLSTGALEAGALRELLDAAEKRERVYPGCEVFDAGGDVTEHCKQFSEACERVAAALRSLGRLP